MTLTTKKLITNVVESAFSNPELSNSNLHAMITFIYSQIQQAVMRENNPVPHFEYLRKPRNDLELIQDITSRFVERIQSQEGAGQ